MQQNVTAVLHITLRMPLYTDEGQRVVGDSLDYIIGRTADCKKRASEMLNSLMVRGVYCGAQTVKLIEIIIPAQTAVVDRMLLVVGNPFVQISGLQILPDAAAEIDVDKLQPLADAENRLPVLDKEIKNLELQDIQLRVNLRRCGIFLTEKTGSNITAAGEHQIISGGSLFLIEGGQNGQVQTLESFFIVYGIFASSGNDNTGMMIRLRHDTHAPARLPLVYVMRQGT